MGKRTARDQYVDPFEPVGQYAPVETENAMTEIGNWSFSDDAYHEVQRIMRKRDVGIAEAVKIYEGEWYPPCISRATDTASSDFGYNVPLPKALVRDLNPYLLKTE